MNSGIYEKSNKMTKEHYALTFKRNGAVMDEIITRVEDRLLRTSKDTTKSHVLTLDRIKLFAKKVHI